MKVIRFIATLLAFLPAQALADNTLELLNYERIINGDSFYASSRRIDLWGITAPNKSHMLYFTTTLYLETLLSEGALKCKRIQTTFYKCFVNEKDVASDLVFFGLAQDHEGQYKLQEEMAKRNRRGLWQMPVSDEF